MSIERLLALVLFGLSAAMLARLGPAAVRMWLVYAGTARRRQQDASGRAPAPGPDVLDRIAQLRSLGYHPIGETSLMLPVGERFARILAADDTESYAIVVDGRTAASGLTGLYSAWRDGTWIGTLHPRGDPLERGGLSLRVARGTLADAVSAHRSGIEELRRDHGRPRSIERMADMLALDDDYRTRFGGRELRPIVLRVLVPTGIAMALTALSLVLFVILPR